MALTLNISCSNHKDDLRSGKEEEFSLATLDADTAKRVKKFLESRGWVVQFNGEYMDTYCSKHHHIGVYNSDGVDCERLPIPETLYKVEVRVRGEQSFNGNGLRFATVEDGERYGSDLYGRWTAVEEYRVVEVEA